MVQFQNEVAEFTYIRSYSRWMPELGRRETWDETVDRTVNFILSERGKLIPEKTIAKIRQYMLSFDVVPSMRLVWAAGPAAKRDNTTIYNCFTQSTPFVTNHGVKSFTDYCDGDVVTVLTDLGNWKNATVHHFGTQQLNQIELWRGGNSLSTFVQATPKHDWLLSNNTRTTSLKVGDVVKHAPAISYSFDYDTATPDQKLYWCYGYVYGDGTRIKSHGEYKYSMVRLCKDDSLKFKDRFEEMGFSTSSSNSLSGDFMAYTGSYLKTLPDLIKEPYERIVAFVHGLLDADGEKNYSNHKVRFVSIQATGKETCDFLSKTLPMCGFYITRQDNLTGQVTNFGPRTDYTVRFTIDDKTCTHSNCVWKVKSITPVENPQEVWCLDVEDDHSFVLPFGISTGNCAFAKIDSIEAFAENLYILMCGSGFAFSVAREAVALLPKVPVMQLPLMQAMPFTIEDSREGWADSVKVLMRVLYLGQDVHFDYSQLRPEGARLSTMGGRASGPAPLINLHTFIRDTMIAAQGRKLKTIECHDICNQIAEAVIVGGVRRSSEMSLSDLDDVEMRNAKNFPFPPRRYMANNSAIYAKQPTAVEFLKEWSALAESGSGERGIFNLVAAREHAPTRRNASLIEGTNPCVTDYTWTMTTEGPKQVKDLINKPFHAIVDGLQYYCPTGFFTTGRKPTLNLITDRGYSIFGITEDHLVKIESIRKRSHGKTITGCIYKKVIDLKVGDRMVLDHNVGLTWGISGEEELGWLLGEVVGDGCHNPKKYASYVKFWGENAKQMADYAADIIRRRLEPSVHFQGASYNSSDQTWSVGCVSLTKFCEQYITPEDKQILPSVEKASSSFQVGFLSGFFDADGCPQGNVKKGISIRLSQSDLVRLRAVQRMLLRLGIASTISSERHKEGMKLMPNGRGGTKLYHVKKSFEIIISRNCIDVFRNRIGFIDQNKEEKLLSLCNSRSVLAYRDTFTAKVKAVFWSMVDERVYDCQVEEVHCFDANGLIVHNCGETAMRDKGFCNLSEAVVRHYDDLDSMLDKVETATWIGAIQSTFTHFPYLRPQWKKNCEEERLMGVSLTGVCDSPEIINPTILTGLRNRARKIARHAAKSLGVNYSSAITLMKPSGTVSQLVNSSSGIHPRYAKNYIRRFRISRMDPLYHMMKEQGIDFVPDNGCDPKNPATLVCQFVVKSPEHSITRHEMDAIQQLEVYRMFQEHWCEHNASCTIYVKDDEWFSVGNWVYHNWNIVNGLSFLPSDNGRYTLAPYEDIDDATADKMIATQRHPDYSQLSKFELQDNTEGARTLACSGSQCELK